MIDETRCMPPTLRGAGVQRHVRRPALSLTTHEEVEMATKTNPGWARERARIGGRALRMCGALQKQLAIALGKSEPYVSQLVRGHPAAGRYLEMIEQLAEAGYTEAGPLAVAPMAILVRLQAQVLTDPELAEAIREMLLEETVREGPENVEQSRLMIAHGDGDPELEEALEERLIRSMAAEATLVGLLWERRRRRIPGVRRVN